MALVIVQRFGFGFLPPGDTWQGLGTSFHVSMGEVCTIHLTHQGEGADVEGHWTMHRTPISEALSVLKCPQY
jgi:hypothetical protein